MKKEKRKIKEGELSALLAMFSAFFLFLGGILVLFALFYFAGDILFDYLGWTKLLR